MKGQDKKPYTPQNIHRPIQGVGIKRQHPDSYDNGNNPLMGYPDPTKQVKTDVEYQMERQDQPMQDPQNNMLQFQQQYDARNVRFCNEDYSFLSNQLLSRFSQIETAKDFSASYPLFKILRGIAKKFMLNELEIIFFLHIIEETKWNFQDPLIADFTPNFNFDFLNIIHEVQEQSEYQKLILYLLCCAYAIKGYLNESTDVHFINVHLHQFVNLDKFQKFMEMWRQKFMHGAFKIMPRAINKFFIKLVKTPRDQQKGQLEDYNSLVDQIISISPPYSSEKAHLQAKQEAYQAPQQTIQTQSSLLGPKPGMSQEVGSHSMNRQPSILNQSIYPNNFLYQNSQSIFQPQISRMNSMFNTEQYYLNDHINKSQFISHGDDDLNFMNQQPSPKNEKQSKPIVVKQESKIKNEEIPGADDHMAVPNMLLRGHSISAFLSNNDFVKDERP